MSEVSIDKKKVVLTLLEIALEMATSFQLGRLCGMAEQIARTHEEEEMCKQIKGEKTK